MNVQELINAVTAANANSRRALDAFSQINQAFQAERNERAATLRNLAQMQGEVRGMHYAAKRTGNIIGLPDVMAIEDIPGRRVPFDVSVKLRIAAGSTTKVEQPYTVTEHGPFVAVARYATFLSTYTFQASESGSDERYVGRSFGRFRLVSSVLDFMDAQQGWQKNEAWSGMSSEGCGDSDTSPATSFVERPTSRSPFRTMTFDGYVKVSNTVFPRQNDSVPTALWAPGLEQMVQLPVLDYFERSETINFEVEPTHVNNPPAGNVQSVVGVMPFLDGQYDGHEGIKYDSWLCTDGSSDTVTRSPSGVLHLGYIGYRILTPAGVRISG